MAVETIAATTPGARERRRAGGGGGGSSGFTDTSTTVRSSDSPSGSSASISFVQCRRESSGAPSVQGARDHRLTLGARAPRSMRDHAPERARVRIGGADQHG